MVIYLHNGCEKFPKDLVRNFEIQAVAEGDVKNKKGTMYLKMGNSIAKISCCPYCGKKGKQIVEEYFS